MKIIQKEGVAQPIPQWIANRSTRTSLIILADSQFKDWPTKDGICSIFYQEKWPINRWTLAVKTGTIRLEHHRIVVLYLEATRAWQDMPPVKNCLQALCKAIRNTGGSPRVFIANHLPPANNSSLKNTNSVVVSYFILQQATRSIGRAMGCVYELSLFEHFTSSTGKVLSPKHLYFSETGNLTQLGCLICRECICREVGIKNYWFGEKTDQ